MTNKLKLVEERTSITVDGTPMFQITAACTDPGGLPSSDIFVHELVDPDDPGADKFVRVAEIADFDDIPGDRDDALAADQDYWRDATVVLRFTDVQVANEAYGVLSERIDKLVEDYTVYSATFHTASETLEFPTVDQGKLEEAKASYAAARAAYDAADVAVTTAEAAEKVAEDALSLAQDEQQLWSDEKGTACSLRDQSHGANQDFLDLLDATAPNAGNSKALKEAVAAFINEFDSVQMWCGSQCAELTVSLPANDIVASDIGKSVYDNTAAVHGNLIAFKQESGLYIIWVNESVMQYNPGDSFRTATSSVGTVNTVDHAVPVELSHLRPELDILRAAHSDFQVAYDAAVVNKNAFTLSVGDHDDACSTTTTELGKRDNAVSEAQSALDTAVSARVSAEGAAEAAYQSLMTAYQLVKDMCPSWAPDQALPAQP